MMSWVLVCLTLFQLNYVHSSLDVRLPPRIIKSPAEYTVYRPDDSITLECLAEGSPKPQYEWYKNGLILHLPGNAGNLFQPVEGTIEIKPAATFDEGYYQCRATNQYGTALSNVTYLQRAVLSPYAPGIPTFESPVLQEGQPYKLQCNPTKCIPKPVYTWATSSSTVDMSQESITLDKRIQLDENGTLHFSYVLPEDQRNDRLYKCNIYNPHLDTTMGGSYSHLNVQAVPNGVKPFKPVLGFASPLPVIAIEGRNLTLRCFFTGNPDPMLQWSRKSFSNAQIPLPSGRHRYDNHNTKLLITNVEKSDEGQYVCKASNNQGSDEYILSVEVQAAPIFKSIADKPHSVNVTEGDDVTFNCSSYAVPKAKVVWMRNGETLKPEELPRKFRLSPDRTSLTVQRVCRDCEEPVIFRTTDLMVIQCNSSNNHGFAFSDGYINVLKKTVIIDVPQNQYASKVEETTKVTFGCNGFTDDSTPLRIRWFRKTGGDYESVYPRENRIIFGDGNTSLTFAIPENGNLSEWDWYKGTYKCELDNGYSKETAEVVLDVEDFVTTEPPPVLLPSRGGIGDYWWILLIIAAILLLFIFIVCCCFCCFRNKGDVYLVDKKERRNGNDPEKELEKDGFRDYQRPPGEPLKGSRASLGSSIKMDSDDEGSLNAYGDIDEGKFGEDGSFIGDYGTDSRRPNYRV